MLSPRWRDACWAHVITDLISALSAAVSVFTVGTFLRESHWYVIAYVLCVGVQIIAGVSAGYSLCLLRILWDHQRGMTESFSHPASQVA